MYSLSFQQEIKPCKEFHLQECPYTYESPYITMGCCLTGSFNRCSPIVKLFKYMLFTWESSFFSTYKSCVSVSWFLCLFRKRYYCFLFLDYLSFVFVFPQCSTIQQYWIFSKKGCLVTSFSCVLSEHYFSICPLF